MASRRLVKNADYQRCNAKNKELYDKIKAKHKLRTKVAESTKPANPFKVETEKKIIKTTIALVMIVKNESKNIPRLFKSLIADQPGLIDYISIVDTGSTDNTVETIEGLGEEYKVPTKVLHRPFDGFDTSRTHAVRSIKETFPEATYMLLSDADFVWEIGKDFNKKLLFDQKYMVLQFTDHQQYFNVRMLKVDVDWDCLGVTHEFWSESDDNSYYGKVNMNKLRTIKINDKEDGGCKENKFIRDEFLLGRELNKGPDCDKRLFVRYHFYYAQTLRDMKRYYESLEWYKKRARLREWPEEVYYSLFQIGFIYHSMADEIFYLLNILAWGKEQLTEDDIRIIKKYSEHLNNLDYLYDRAIDYYAEAAVYYYKAYEYRPIRAESLEALCWLLQRFGLHEQAYEMAGLGNKIKYPDDCLFLSFRCYPLFYDGKINKDGYIFMFIRSVSCYYLDKIDEGRGLCETLFRDYDVIDCPHAEMIKRTAGFYI